MNHLNFKEAEVPEPKITDYLLRPDHPEGASKAKFFLARGFSVEHWEQLADALRQHAGDGVLSNVVKGRFGTKYVVDAPIRCPDGSSPMVRSVWIVPTESTTPRLVTTHPLM